MHVYSLHIKKFKNLVNFKIEFDDSEKITVLLGRNGSAKSNLIEALVRIFAGLRLGTEESLPDFDFDVRYRVKGKDLRLQWNHRNKTAIKVNGHTMKLEEFEVQKDAMLPERVVIYYSGESERYSSIVDKADQMVSKDTLNSSVLGFRRVIYLRPLDARFLALCFFAQEDAEVEKFFRDVLRISGFDSVLLRLRRTRKGGSASDFWGVDGALLDMLTRIKGQSLAPFSERTNLKVDFNTSRRQEMLYLYLPSKKAFREATSSYTSVKFLYQALDTMRLGKLVTHPDDVRIRVKVTGTRRAIQSRDLSEGELQLLSVLGLMRFTEHDESLYLLDEPDTHLNPQWGLQYLRYLKEIGEIDQKSHTLIATHDPMLVAGLKRTEIRLLSRRPDGKGIEVKIPREDPKGRGIAALLTSEIYGFDSQLDPDTSDLMRERRRIAVKKDLSDSDLVRLDEINSELHSLNYLGSNLDQTSQELSDALFRRYEAEGLNLPEFTPDQIQKRRRIADEIVKGAS